MGKSILQNIANMRHWSQIRVKSKAGMVFCEKGSWKICLLKAAPLPLMYYRILVDIILLIKEWKNNVCTYIIFAFPLRSFASRGKLMNGLKLIWNFWSACYFSSLLLSPPPKVIKQKLSLMCAILGYQYQRILLSQVLGPRYKYMTSQEYYFLDFPDILSYKVSGTNFTYGNIHSNLPLYDNYVYVLEYFYEVARDTVRCQLLNSIVTNDRFIDFVSKKTSLLSKTKRESDKYANFFIYSLIYALRPISLDLKFCESFFCPHIYIIL